MPEIVEIDIQIQVSKLNKTNTLLQIQPLIEKDLGVWFRNVQSEGRHGCL